MKTSFTYLLCIICFPVWAQPTLNRLYDYSPGDVYTYKKMESGELDTTRIISYGANVIWDFRDIKFETTAHTDSIISPTYSSHPSNFGGCSFVYVEYNGLQQYYSKKDNKVAYMGNNFGNTPNRILPSAPTIVLPATYAISGYNNFAPTEVFIAGVGNGTYTGRYNAYGTLKLPGGISIPDVGLYVVNGGDASLSFSDYIFALEDSVSPLFRIQFKHTRRRTTVGYAYITTDALSEDNYAEDRDVAIYPNPANDVIHIKAPVMLSAIAIYDVLHRKVFIQKTSCGHCTLDIAHLSAGAYVIEAESKQRERFVGKFVKL